MEEYDRFMMYRDLLSNSTAKMRTLITIVMTVCAVVVITLYNSYPNNWLNSKIAMNDNVIGILEKARNSNSPLVRTTVNECVVPLKANTFSKEQYNALEWMNHWRQGSYLLGTKSEIEHHIRYYTDENAYLCRRVWENDYMRLPLIPSDFSTYDIGPYTGLVMMILMTLLAMTQLQRSLATKLALTAAARNNDRQRCWESLVLDEPLSAIACCTNKREYLGMTLGIGLMNVFLGIPLVLQAFILWRYDLHFSSGWHLSYTRLSAAVTIDIIAVAYLFVITVSIWYREYSISRLWTTARKTL